MIDPIDIKRKARLDLQDEILTRKWFNRIDEMANEILYLRLQMQLPIFKEQLPRESSK